MRFMNEFNPLSLYYPSAEGVSFSRDLVRAVQADSEASEWPQLQLCPQRLGPPPTH